MNIEVRNKKIKGNRSNVYAEQQVIRHETLEKTRGVCNGTSSGHNMTGHGAASTTV